MICYFRRLRGSVSFYLNLTALILLMARFTSRLYLRASEKYYDDIDCVTLGLYRRNFLIVRAAAKQYFVRLLFMIFITLSSIDEIRSE